MNTINKHKTPMYQHGGQGRKTGAGQPVRGGRGAGLGWTSRSLPLPYRSFGGHVVAWPFFISTKCRKSFRLWKWHIHRVVNHSAKQYVDGMAHTNTVEGFWSLLKHGIIGIYYSVSYKHLNCYCDEFSFCYNAWKITDVQRFHYSMTKAHGKYLNIRQL